MAITFVQSKSTGASSNSNPTTLAFTKPCTSGNLIVVFVSQSTRTVSSVTDSFTNNYTKAVDTTVNGSGHFYMFYAYNITGGTNTVTVNYSSTGTATSVIAREYSGVLKTSTPLFQAVSAGGSSTAADSGLTSATTGSYDVLVVGAATNTSSSTFSLGNGFANLANEGTASTYKMGAEDKIITAGSQAQSAQLTLSVSANWGCIAAAFLADPSGMEPNNLRPHAFSPGLAR